MCPLCEGYTEEEMIAAWAADVERDGWMPLGVSGDPSWIYTIGLRWSFGHPELIVVHPDLSKAKDLIGHAVEEIRTGRRFRPGSTWTTSCGIPTRFGTVHHKNMVGEWFARWSQIAAACGESFAGLRALQSTIVGCACDACASQPSLDRRCGPDTLARAARRRRRRRR